MVMLKVVISPNIAELKVDRVQYILIKWTT